MYDLRKNSEVCQISNKYEYKWVKMTVCPFFGLKLAKYVVLIVNNIIDYYLYAREAHQKILNFGGGATGLMGRSPPPILDKPASLTQR